MCARDIFPNNTRRHVFSIFVPVTHEYVNRRLDFSAFAQADNADDARARPLFERSEYTRNKLYRR